MVFGHVGALIDPPAPVASDIAMDTAYAKFGVAFSILNRMREAPRTRCAAENLHMATFSVQNPKACEENS